jgi:hypothetical protein
MEWTWGSVTHNHHLMNVSEFTSVLGELRFIKKHNFLKRKGIDLLIPSSLPTREIWGPSFSLYSAVI